MARPVGIGSTGDHQCAIDLAGKAWCWGDNSGGQVGDGTVEGPAPHSPTGLPRWWHPTPIAVPAGLVFKPVVAGPYATCALTDAGAAWCWGENQRGLLGTGSTARQVALPTPMTGNVVFRNISISDDRTCGVTHARAVNCTGYANFLRMTGPDLATPTLSPFVPLADTVALSVWDQCALFFASVTCWGGSSTEQTSVPMSLRTMSVGLSSWFGLGADGQGYFWGTTDNWPGGLGEAAPFEGALTLSAVGGNADRPCAIEAGTGILYCWSEPAGPSGAPSDPVAFRPPA